MDNVEGDDGVGLDRVRAKPCGDRAGPGKMGDMGSSIGEADGASILYG